MTTDLELARLAHRVTEPAPGIYDVPCATAIWDGLVLTLRPKHPPAAELLAQYPLLAIHFSPRALATGPTIAALEADYPAATAQRPAVCPQTTFTARLATCRSCPLWSETARAGRGACDSTQLPCSCRRLWRTDETCPLSKWP